MTVPMLRGFGTALVTPFLDDGHLDEASLRALVEWQIQEGVDFLVPAGSTGEAATLALIAEVEAVTETEDLEEPEPTLRSRAPCPRPLG